MKGIVKIIVEEFIYGSHVVSLGAVGITLSIVLLFELHINLSVLFIAYLAYQIVYTYNHARELSFDKKSNPERVRHISRRQKWVRISPLMYSGLLGIFLSFSNWFTIMLVVFIVAGGILYTEYFKSIPILGWKTYYVSFFWAILILIVPLFYRISYLIPYLYLVVFIFIRGLVNTTFSDMKDVESDRERGLKTFPVYWGKRKTINALHIINLISMIPLLIGIYMGYVPYLALVLIITVVNGVFYLTKSLYLDNKNLRLLSYILIDGEYILWPMIILLVKILI